MKTNLVPLLPLSTAGASLRLQQQSDLHRSATLVAP